MIVVLLLSRFNLQESVSMLLLYPLKTFLQVHDLVHVVVLGEGVVLISQSLVVKLDQLRGVTPLLEAL